MNMKKSPFLFHPVDSIFALIAGRKKMFSLGWGNKKVLSKPLNHWFYKNPQPIHVEKKPARSKSEKYLIEEIYFDSPLMHELPQSTHKAHALYLNHPNNTTACIILAGSREEGYGLRKSIYESLVEQGIDLIIPENPFCGKRRPIYQQDFSVKTVSDQALLTIAMVEEARSLLLWLKKQGYQKLIVAGFSMGGVMSCMTASLVNFEVGLCAMGAGLSPYPTFTEYLLSYTVDYSKIIKPGGDIQEAKESIARLFEQSRLDHFPLPKLAHKAIVLGCSNDGFVSSEETAKLAQHLNCELRWIWAGHISALFTERQALRNAVKDVANRI